MTSRQTDERPPRLGQTVREVAATLGGAMPAMKTG
jgi:hypothetical protein